MTYLEKAIANDDLNTVFDTIHRSLTPRTRKLLIVSDPESTALDWQTTLGGSGVEVVSVNSGGEALAFLRQQYLDGLVIDVAVSDIPCSQLVEEIQAQTAPQKPPIILFDNANGNPEMESQILSLTRSGVVRYADSPEGLLRETVLLLHRADADLSDAQRELMAAARRYDATIAGKKVLVVDDDVRNIFALTTVLEQHGLQVIHAENGRAGIEVLRRYTDIDGVLMDIMMPEMDGYETIRAIRQIPELRLLPIVAVTAKAMKGDRAKCIEAGASDYITKPVDLDQLFSILRVWMARGQRTSQNLSVAR
jgi:CheY-like chemotaxis protein